MRQPDPIASGKHLISLLRLLAAVILLLILFTPGASALAHANLVSSDPPTGSALAQAPKVITLEYSEDLDPTFTQVELLNGSFQVVIPGPGVIDPAKPKIMTLAVNTPIPDGIYSAVWKARSAVDGHITHGTVGFSVGASAPRVSLLPPPGTPDPASALPLPIDAASRWLSYLFATRLLRRLALIGLGGLLVGTLAFILVQAGQASGKPFFELFGAPLAELLGSRTGLILGIRLVLMAVIAVIIWRALPPIEAGRGETWWLLAALGIGVLATFSLQSHAAASDQLGAILLDILHLLAMSAWLGGLLPLALLLLAGRRGQVSLPPLAALVPRFSRLAMVSVDVLAISGLYAVLTQVQTFDALVGTTYGQAVIVETALVAVLIALGAVNLLILSPKLAAGAGDPAKALQRTTAVELGIGLVVLLAAGVLTSSQPAATALDAQRRLGFLDSTETDDVKLTLRVAPVQIGDNEFGVDVVDSRPGADASQPQVLLRLGVIGGGLGQTQVEAASTGGGRFTARGTYITLPGQWEIDVILRRPGYDDVVHRFSMQVGVGSATGLSSEDQTPNPIQPDSASVAAGHTLFTTNCVPCHGTSGKGDGPVGLTLNPRPADLTIHTIPGVHTDGQLFKWITEGYPGSVMPAFGKFLSDTDRWNLVNYIRTLAKPTN